MVFQFTDPLSSKTHYLAGTMHLGNKEAYAFIDPIMAILKNCTAYAGEMNLDEAAASDISSSYKLPEGQSIRDWLSERQFERMSRILRKAYGLDLASMEYYRPMLISNLIATKQLVNDNRPPLDHYIWQKAKVLDLRLFGVETVEEQRSILEEMPIDLQVKSLKRTCRQISSFSKYLKKLTTVYASGDVQRIYQLTKRQMGGIRSLMIHQRNQIMLDRILDLSKQEERVLIGVGAGHIGGNTGLRAGLLRNGFTFKPYAS